MWSNIRSIGKELKTVLLLMLMLTISMTGLTLSAYVRQAKLFNDGWVGPKYFAFNLGNTVTHRDLEPGGSVTYPFTVSNFNSNGTAQVALQVSVSISYPTSLAGTGRIRATLSCNGQSLGTSETGTLDCAGSTLPANKQTTDEYTLTLTWLDADLIYLSDKTTQAFDNSQINIDVSGYQ